MDGLNKLFDARVVSVILIILGLFFLFSAWCLVGTNVTASYVIGIFSSLTSVAALVLYDQSIRRRTATALILTHTVLLIFIYARIYADFDIMYSGKPVDTETFADNIYFSIVTLTTLGYGDFQPPEKLRILAGLQAITGYVYLGFIISITSRYGNKKLMRGISEG